MGINRAAQLLQEIVKAKVGWLIDINQTKPRRKIIKFDIEKFKKFTGSDINLKTAIKYLQLLNFKILPDITLKNNKDKSVLVDVPAVRRDIEIFEDLVEEIIRLDGCDNLKTVPPHIHLVPSGFEDEIILKDKIRKILIGLGLDEVINYACVSEDEGKHLFSNNKLIELENPVSKEFYYLKPALATGFIKNVDCNFKFFDEIGVFEIGKIFEKIDKGGTVEKLVLGIALASKNKEQFFKLKGLVDVLLKKLGLSDFLFVEAEENEQISKMTQKYLEDGTIIKIESSEIVLGYFGEIKRSLNSKAKISVFEIDLNILLDLINEEYEYQPLSKYPSSMRDISILVDTDVRVGDINQAIQQFDLKYIEDVDLIDEYEDAKLAGKRSLTFRIVFQAEDKTLTDVEVNQEMDKITCLLKSKFKAEIR